MVSPNKALVYKFQVNDLAQCGDQVFATCAEDGSLRIWSAISREQTLQFQVVDQVHALCLVCSSSINSVCPGASFWRSLKSTNGLKFAKSPLWKNLSDKYVSNLKSKIELIKWDLCTVISYLQNFFIFLSSLATAWRLHQ